MPTEDSLSRTWLRRTIENHHREQERQKELEHERKLAEIRNAVPAQLQTARTTPSRKPSRKSAKELARQQAIAEIITEFPSLKGPEYCSKVDERLDLPQTRQAWRDEGCPATYSKAYRDPQWAVRIQKEKNQIARDFKALITRGTRGTRYNE